MEMNYQSILASSFPSLFEPDTEIRRIALRILATPASSIALPIFGNGNLGGLMNLQQQQLQVHNTAPVAAYQPHNFMNVHQPVLQQIGPIQHSTQNPPGPFPESNTEILQKILEAQNNMASNQMEMQREKTEMQSSINELQKDQQEQKKKKRRRRRIREQKRREQQIMNVTAPQSPDDNGHQQLQNGRDSVEEEYQQRGYEGRHIESYVDPQWQ